MHQTDLPGRRGPVNSYTILTEGGDLNEGDGEPPVAKGTLFDGMLLAQDGLGQITWDKLTETVAEGSYRKYNTGGDVAPLRRVCVIDLDAASLRVAMDATIRVLKGSAK